MLNLLSDMTIELTRGDTARFSITIDNDITHTPYIIQENDRVTFSIKKKIKDQKPIFSKSFIGSNIIHIEPADTKDLEFGKYVYDVEIITEFGDVYTPIQAPFKLLGEVTC